VRECAHARTGKELIVEKPLILPSIMCEKPWQMREYVSEFEICGIDAIHFDVMDGHYVPNVMCGSDDFKALRSLTSLPIDVHIMAIDPDTFIDFFELQQGDWCSFHPEVCCQPYRQLERLRGMGVRAGLALSPAVSLDYVENCLSVIDFVLVMSVSPGFAGQWMTPDHLGKLARLNQIVSKADHKIDVIIDGNTVPSNAKRMLAAGATGLVVGTSSLMKDGPEGFAANYERYLSDIA
jgi:ribulose-phosphate 3-epimerase